MVDLRHSRTLRLAEGASERNAQSLFDKLSESLVKISFGPSESDFETAKALIDTLRRMPIRLQVDAVSGQTSRVDQLARLAHDIDPERGLELDPASVPEVHVAVNSNVEAATVSGTPVRHGAKIVRGRLGELDAGETSGLGVFTCASLLAGEVFKQIAEVRPERATPLADYAWCPVTLTSEPWGTPLDLALPNGPLALIGVGAIGTAIVRVLDLLGTTGTIQLVDPERFEPENLGTYSLGVARDALDNPWKVDLAAAGLPSMRATPFVGTASEYVVAVDEGQADFPELVLTALDSGPARREAQLIWADRIVDGATGDTTCGMHDISFGEGPCLLCLFPERRQGPSAADRLSAETGLPVDLLRSGDQPLTTEHLQGLGSAQRTRLKAQLGKPICGLADAFGLSTLDSEDFRPSVPFVSQQAAALVVGRALATTNGLTPSANFVQYDALIGPTYLSTQRRRSSRDCYCLARRALLDRLRLRRANSDPGIESV